MSLRRSKSPLRSRVPDIERLEERRFLTAVQPAVGMKVESARQATSDLSASPRRVVGYLPEYRYSSLSKIDFSALTHINYFSISATTAGALSTGNIVLSHLATARNAAHAAGVTMSITVGPQSFSTMTGTPAALSAFVTNVIQFVTTNDLDGIDIDWEPPASNSTDKARYGLLVDALYAEARPRGLLLSAAVNPITTEIPAIQANKLDWVNIMGYDFAPANHSSYADSVQSLVRWNNYGVIANKLVLGVPFYGRAGTTWSNTVTKTYNTIIEEYRTANGSYPAATMDVINGQNFNGPSTITAKSQYVIDHNFGGVMIWELGQDHFTTQGGYDQYSLLPAIKNVIQPTQDRTPPAVTLKAFEFETQRQVRFAFNENVAGSIAASDLTIRRVDDSSVLATSGFSYDPISRIATFNLPAHVPDGDYRATLAAGSVSDITGNAMPTASTLDFFVLAGDVNRDRSVNFSDLVILSQAYATTGRTFSQGNLDYSAGGTVDFADLVILSQNYEASLPDAFTFFAAPTSEPGPKRGRSVKDSVL
jgi:GH18 family chitinase